MLLTYDNYPMLLFLSYTIDNAPELPFVTENDGVLNEIQNSTILTNLFSLITINNAAKEKKHRNYLLDSSLLHKMESSEYFKSQAFFDFFNSPIKPGTGTICFQGNGQFVYMLLQNDETKRLTNMDGQYISVALFKENMILGFEEALITGNTFEIQPTGYYHERTKPGCFLSFITVFLSYLNKKQNLPEVSKEINKTSESIWLLE